MGNTIGYINALREIYTTLRKKKVNTLLAMGGIFLGVFILLVSTGIYNAFIDGILAKSLGRNRSFFVVTTDGNFSMEYDDIQKVRDHFSDSECICIEQPFQKTDVHPNNGKNTSARVCFMMPEYYAEMMLGMKQGRFINDKDLVLKRKICVIGKNVAESMYGNDFDPCGNVVEINKVSYTIVGVMYKPIAPINIFGNEEDMVFIPYTTADAAYGLEGKISQLCAFLPADTIKGENSRQLKQFIEHIHDVEDEEYEVDVVDYTKTITQWKYLFSGLGYLTLIVGIGMIIASLLNLFDVMLVSIMERKEEFGIKLCLGATPKFIVRSVVMEGLAISVVAGVVAILLAAVVMIALQHTISIELVGKPAFTITLCGIVFAIMVAGGAMSGYLCIRKIIYKEVATLVSKPD